ncbi:polysaccharide pyruvyl transferase family protein [Colwellia sp. E2M01]|uniref:polysaccharide pyruvyl transferase family protein n=1 Tax=Colwellia sp. E2M01 TaxID=2841561 RepID=UPI001C093F3C|nr:polysaccharide pyruvyl transferase family protein [Colwellia sp. E2M01]
MKLVTLFDTSIATENVGDFIIMDAVREQVDKIVPTKQIITLPTHDYIGKEGRRLLRASEYSLVGGTNLLSSNLLKYQQWKFRLSDINYLNNSILMGVGWWQYQNTPNYYTRKVWNKVLHKDMIHSVRDEYTKNQLLKMGIKNVLNTSCATMWNLTPEHCSQIKTMKGDTVVLTLTDYNQVPEKDIKLVNTLLKNYSTVYFWPQGSGDIQYLQSIYSSFSRDVSILNPNLESLNNALCQPDVDYIGTRLHAGIRALQLKVRTVIIGIDNRALEKSRDFNLEVIDRTQIDDLDALINQEIRADIKLPEDNINKWKAQFE